MKLSEVAVFKPVKYHKTDHKTTVKKHKKVKPLKVKKPKLKPRRSTLIKPLHYYMQKIYKSSV